MSYTVPAGGMSVTMDVGISYSNSGCNGEITVVTVGDDATTTSVFWHEYCIAKPPEPRTRRLAPCLPLVSSLSFQTRPTAPR